MSRLYCIDASIYIFRAYFALPERWFNEQGYALNAVYGYTRFLCNFLREVSPEFLMAAFDESLGSGYRHQLYPEYKSNRVLPDEGLAFQLAACRTITEQLGIKSYAGARYEADDYIASAASLAGRDGLAVTVVSRDKDLVQVMQRGEDEWWDYANGRRWRRAQWEAEQQLKVSQVADWLALVGDSVDAIPGVPGIGRLTAARLLARFGDIAGIYSHLDELADSGIRGAARVRAALVAHRQQVLLARRLTGLHVGAIRARGSEAFRYRPRLNGLQAHLEALGCGRPWSRRIVDDLRQALS